MISKLKLTNFRKHTSAEFAFTDGLTVLRAPNEGGKSTAIEAFMYALFGTGALRSTLEEAVTWGQPVASLKVEATLTTGHIFTRSKSGAEVTLNGEVFVTGQREVANFAAELLGGDAATAQLVLIAQQGSLRGTLENGPKATGGLLETLASFDLFDTLLERAQEHLALGSVTLYEDRLKMLQEQRDSVELQPAPDKVAFDAAEADAAAKLAALEEERKVIAVELPPMDKEYSELSMALLQRGNLETEINRHRDHVDGNVKQLQNFGPIPPDMSERIAALEVEAEAERTRTERLKVWKAYRDWADQPCNRLVESDEVVAATEKQLAKQAADLSKLITELTADIKVHQAHVVTSSVCPTCGSDVSKSERVVKENFVRLETIATLEREIAEQRKRLCEVGEKARIYASVLAAQNELSRAFGQHAALFDIDASVTPNILRWRGDVPAETPSDAPDRLRSAKELQRARDARLAQRTLLEKLIAEGEATIAAKRARRDRIAWDEARWDIVSRRVPHMIERKNAIAEDVQRIEAESKARRDLYKAQSVAHQTGAQAIERLEREIAKTRSDLDNVGFNNGLVKKIRAARPVVTSKLWNLVLASVSTLFSQMRGEKSVVSRSEKGFLVNGQAVESLSGSTLDLLGLAIRVALAKTFMPACDLMVFDEPGAGCDAARTEALVGFLAGCGIGRVILITHDDTSTAFADNVIEVAK